MNYAFMGRCSHVQGFLPVASLNERLEYGDDGEAIELVETVTDPKYDFPDDTFSRDNVVDARAFVRALPDRLRDIAYRYYWRDQSHSEIAAELGVTRTAIVHAIAKINGLGSQHFGLATA